MSILEFMRFFKPISLLGGPLRLLAQVLAARVALNYLVTGGLSRSFVEFATRKL